MLKLRTFSRASSVALALAFGAPFALGADGALAADAPASQTKPAAADSSAVSEVVVTAEFRATNLQKTPISITAVNAEQLRQRSITNVTEVAQAAPNVTMVEGSGGFGNSNQAYIRGIGQQDFSFAFEPRVGFYIDDVYYATVFGSVFDLLDVDRVEIERGPQGTLNGRNSVGGAIRIFTKKPTGDGSGYVEASYGNYNHDVIRGAIDMSLVPDKLFLRLAAGQNRQDGWVDRYNFACLYPSLAGKLPNNGTPSRNGCQDGTLGGTDVWDTRAQLRWIINDKVEDNISADYTNDRSEPPADTLLRVSDSMNPAWPSSSGAPAGTPNALAVWMNNIGAPIYGLPSVPTVVNPTTHAITVGSTPQLQALLGALQSGPYANYAIFGNPGYANPAEQMATPAVNTVRSWGLSNELDMDLGDQLHLKSITAYRSYTGEFGTSQSQIALPIQEVYNEVAHHQVSQELRLSGEAFQNRLDWTVGGFYLSTFNENTGRVDDEGFGVYIAPQVGTIPYLFDQYVDDKSTLQNESAFVHGVVHITDQLSIEGGVRFSHESKDYSYVREYFTGAPSVFLVAPNTSISRWDPRVAINYQLNPNILLYTSYSTGYTAGGFDPRPFSAADAQLPFGPESVKSYEAGFKTELLDHKLRLNAAAFYTQWDNIQLSVSGCSVGCPTTSPFYYANAGDAHIKGFEAEFEARPFSSWLITGGVGYTDFHYVKLNPYVNLAGDPTGITLNSPLPNAPAWKVSLGTQYTFDLGRHGTLTPRVDYVYQSTVYFGSDTFDPYERQAGYGMVNARLTWRQQDSKWSVAGYVTNLGNKLYYTDKFNELNSFGTATGTVGMPREFGVTVRRDF